ncbi:hypothetical protein XA68_15033 [Ophiocordyceps unilateralis]|uniref:Uncharacterized protein n=1 Tax=Ophiocordyceps unilateralis TaxID=268505 RepID=A0A2A9P7P2_OPHUN|nr:hypothetical protein XA68_15033 [Ophiocordyceps unilateralis]
MRVAPRLAAAFASTLSVGATMMRKGGRKHVLRLRIAVLLLSTNVRTMAFFLSPNRLADCASLEANNVLT